MKKTIIVFASILSFTACNKSESGNDVPDFETLKTEVLSDFTTNVATTSYKDLSDGADNLYNSLLALENNPTEDNLLAARTAWKDMRTVWEQCEGFLFGPVEDNDYDPNMDTWPTDYVQMDSLLSSSQSLTLTDIQNFTLSLRGFHPIEYIIFGDHGNRTAASLTARQKAYMISLAEDLKNNCHALYASWTEAPVNYANEVKTAGKGSQVFATKKEAYFAMAEAMIAICEEVGEGKMKEPFDNMDPATVESPYSGNSLIDFKNNIIGLENVYLGRYKTDGLGLNDLVAAKNKALDLKIQSQMTAAINSFDNITVPYEDAIISQRVQAQQVMQTLGTLKATLDDELKPFLQQYITD